MFPLPHSAATEKIPTPLSNKYSKKRKSTSNTVPIRSSLNAGKRRYTATQSEHLTLLMTYAIILRTRLSEDMTILISLKLFPLSQSRMSENLWPSILHLRDWKFQLSKHRKDELNSADAKRCDYYFSHAGRF